MFPSHTEKTCISSNLNENIKIIKNENRKIFKKKYKLKKTFNKIQKLNLQCSPCTSNYISLERITIHMGIYTSGKISQKASRINIEADEIIARRDQDLYKILKINTVKTNSSYCQNDAHNYNSKNQITPPIDLKRNIIENFEENNSAKSSNLNFINSKSFNENEKAFAFKNIFETKKIITHDLYPFIKIMNERKFPHISLADNLKKELKRFRKDNDKLAFSEQKYVPKEINHEQSSILSNSSKDELNNSCKLNICPELLHNSKMTNKTFFDPNVTEINDKNSGVSLNSSCSNYFTDSQKSFSLLPLSQDSSDSPIWKMNISPINFPDESPTTPITSIYPQKSFSLLPLSQDSSDSPIWKMNISPITFPDESPTTPITSIYPSDI